MPAPARPAHQPDRQPDGHRPARRAVDALHEDADLPRPARPGADRRPPGPSGLHGSSDRGPRLHQRVPHPGALRGVRRPGHEPVRHPGGWLRASTGRRASGRIWRASTSSSSWPRSSTTAPSPSTLRGTRGGGRLRQPDALGHAVAPAAAARHGRPQPHHGPVHGRPGRLLARDRDGARRAGVRRWAWQTQAEWTQSIIDTYWQQVFWHEFGHSMGLEHNFMGNVDQLNFTPRFAADGKTPLEDRNGNPLYAMYSSSIMEYNATPARLVWTQGWGAYDKGAIAWIYANNGKQPDDPTKDAAVTTASLAPVRSRARHPGRSIRIRIPRLLSRGTDPRARTTRPPQAASSSAPSCGATRFTSSTRPSAARVTWGSRPARSSPTRSTPTSGSTSGATSATTARSGMPRPMPTAPRRFIVDMRRFLSQWAFDWSPASSSTLLFRVGVTPTATRAPSRRPTTTRS